MIIDYRAFQQDTLKLKISPLQDTLGIKTDSSVASKAVHLSDSLTVKVTRKPVPVSVIVSDTTSVCLRNPVSDFTFFDSTNFILEQKTINSDNFPFLFTRKNRQMKEDSFTSISTHLKPGKILPVKPLHEDWITGIILLAAFLFALVSSVSKNMLPGLSKFFLFRGINDFSSKDVAGMLYWQSNFLNLISFLIISLFGYSAASWYGMLPAGFSGIILWLTSLGIVIAGVTLRHFVCVIVGSISGENDVFREYLYSVYQSYRFSAILIFILIFFISYTTFFNAEPGFIAGLVVFGLMYLIRVMRLMLIFLNRNISIFYLILYLCALEIMPVLISVKYFSGLV
jgi:hypothetical protein